MAESWLLDLADAALPGCALFENCLMLEVFDQEIPHKRFDVRGEDFLKRYTQTLRGHGKGVHTGRTIASSGEMQVSPQEVRLDPPNLLCMEQSKGDSFQGSQSIFFANVPRGLLWAKPYHLVSAPLQQCIKDQDVVAQLPLRFVLQHKWSIGATAGGTHGSQDSRWTRFARLSSATNNRSRERKFSQCLLKSGLDQIRI